VAAVLLFSADPEALVRFYRDMVGVPLREVNLPGVDRHRACDIRQVYFSVWPAGGEAGGAPEHKAMSMRGGAAFYVRDVQAEFERLRALGVEVAFPPRRSPLGIIARPRDPDGNPFEPYQPLPR
jgi:predicted enzyme related to lactoylglutathione lyase